MKVMKHILLFGILSSLLFPITALAQEKQSFNFNMQASYKMSYLADSTDQSSMQEEYMELLLNDSLSLFESVNKRTLDSLDLKKAMNTAFTILRRPYTEFHYQIIKQKGKITTFDVLDNGSFNGPNNFYYIEDESSMQWEIKEDTATIHQLLCQKAELDFGNRKWTAWFTSEIPIPDGPYKFSGLPGLIIKINDASNFWNFELVKLESVSKTITINFIANKRPALTTKKKFLADKKYFRANSIQIKELYGFRILSGRAEMQKSSEDYNKRYNNWIEMPF